MPRHRYITRADRFKLEALSVLMGKGAAELRSNFAVKLSDGGFVWPTSARRVESITKQLNEACAYLHELSAGKKRSASTAQGPLKK